MKNPSTPFKRKKWHQNLHFQMLGDGRKEISHDSFNSVSFSKSIKFYVQPCVHMDRYVHIFFFLLTLKPPPPQPPPSLIPILLSDYMNAKIPTGV